MSFCSSRKASEKDTRLVRMTKTSGLQAEQRVSARAWQISFCSRVGERRLSKSIPTEFSSLVPKGTCHWQKDVVHECSQPHCISNVFWRAILLRNLGSFIEREKTDSGVCVHFHVSSACAVKQVSPTFSPPDYT